MNIQNEHWMTFFFMKIKMSENKKWMSSDDPVIQYLQ